MNSVEITGKTLTIEEVVAVAKNRAIVKPLGQETRKRMEASQQWMHDAIHKKNKVFYGINTGFGSHANDVIASDQASQLSRNVILADVTGIGDPLPREIVRAMMFIRANTISSGHSAVRPAVVEQLIAMLNKNVVPCVPKKGSLGASGDLVPLAHIAIVATCDANGGGYSGKAWYDGELLSGEQAMEKAGIPRLFLIFKEGNSMINGTAFMAAVGCLAINKCESLVEHADIAAAMSLEAFTAISNAFHPDLHAASNQTGQINTAAKLRALLQGSELIDSESRVQDAYSLRCIPQIIGPVKDTIAFARQYIERTLNASIDNPLIFPTQKDFHSVSGGNFHGEGLAFMMDFLSIVISEVANVSDRRSFALLTPGLNNGLPSMLIPSNGINTGLMVAQYVGASLVSDNKTLAHPDSVDSIPTCANQEDHVSMGANGARHLLEIIDNVTHVIAIEFLCATQAIDLRKNGKEKLGVGARVAYGLIREKVKMYQNDHEMAPDIETLVNLITSETIINQVNHELQIGVSQ
jgi:histidine ammonia-lyase